MMEDVVTGLRRDGGAKPLLVRGAAKSLLAAVVGGEVTS